MEAFSNIFFGESFLESLVSKVSERGKLLWKGKASLNFRGKLFQASEGNFYKLPWKFFKDIVTNFSKLLEKAFPSLWHKISQYVSPNFWEKLSHISEGSFPSYRAFFNIWENLYWASVRNIYNVLRVVCLNAWKKIFQTSEKAFPNFGKKLR